MKYKLKAIALIPTVIFSLLLITLYINSAYVAAASVSSERIQHIYDDAGLLSTVEYDKLNELCIDYGAEAGIEIIILTHDDPNAADAEKYIEDFYDNMLYGDSVILLVDLYNRDVCIEGYGLAETYIHSKRGDVIINEITSYLTNGDYYSAFEIFTKRSAAYMKDDSELNYDHEYVYDNPPSSNSEGRTPYINDSRSNTPPSYNARSSSSYDNSYNADNLLKNPWLQLVISLIIGGIVVGIMAHNSGGTMTATANNYIDASRSGLIGRKDNYIRTRVTKVRKPTQNNNNHTGGFNAGGFRGGVSSGGHSHSTSRGKF